MRSLRPRYDRWGCGCGAEVGGHSLPIGLAIVMVTESLRIRKIVTVMGFLYCFQPLPR